MIWNNRKKLDDGFSDEHEKFILKYRKDYIYKHKDEITINKFFKYNKQVLNNYQEFDFEGLKERLLSVFYIPLEDSSEYEDMIKELKNIFHNCQ